MTTNLQAFSQLVRDAAPDAGAKIYTSKSFFSGTKSFQVVNSSDSIFTKIFYKIMKFIGFHKDGSSALIKNIDATKETLLESRELTNLTCDLLERLKDSPNVTKQERIDLRDTLETVFKSRQAFYTHSNFINQQRQAIDPEIQSLETAINAAFDTVDAKLNAESNVTPEFLATLSTDLQSQEEPIARLQELITAFDTAIFGASHRTDKARQTYQDGNTYVLTHNATSLTFATRLAATRAALSVEELILETAEQASQLQASTNKKLAQIQAEADELLTTNQNEVKGSKKLSKKIANLQKRAEDLVAEMATATKQLTDRLSFKLSSFNNENGFLKTKERANNCLITTSANLQQQHHDLNDIIGKLTKLGETNLNYLETSIETQLDRLDGMEIHDLDSMVAFAKRLGKCSSLSDKLYRVKTSLNSPSQFYKLQERTEAHKQTLETALVSFFTALDMEKLELHEKLTLQQQVEMISASQSLTNEAREIMTQARQKLAWDLGSFRYKQAIALTHELNKQTPEAITSANSFDSLDDDQLRYKFLKELRDLRIRDQKLNASIELATTVRDVQVIIGESKELFNKAALCKALFEAYNERIEGTVTLNYTIPEVATLKTTIGKLIVDVVAREEEHARMRQLQEEIELITLRDRFSPSPTLSSSSSSTSLGSVSSVENHDELDHASLLTMNAVEAKDALDEAVKAMNRSIRAPFQSFLQKLATFRQTAENQLNNFFGDSELVVELRKMEAEARNGNFTSFEKIAGLVPKEIKGTVMNQFHQLQQAHYDVAQILTSHEPKITELRKEFQLADIRAKLSDELTQLNGASIIRDHNREFYEHKIALLETAVSDDFLTGNIDQDIAKVKLKITQLASLDITIMNRALVDYRDNGGNNDRELKNNINTFLDQLNSAHTKFNENSNTTIPFMTLPKEKQNNSIAAVARREEYDFAAASLRASLEILRKI